MDRANINTSLNIKKQVEQAPSDFKQLNLTNKQDEKQIQELNELMSIYDKQVCNGFRIQNEENTDFIKKQNNILDKLDELENSCMNRLQNDMVGQFEQFTINEHQDKYRQYILYDLSDVKYDQKAVMIENAKYIKPSNGSKMQVEQDDKHTMDGEKIKTKKQKTKKKIGQDPLSRNNYFDM